MGVAADPILTGGEVQEEKRQKPQTSEIILCGCSVHGSLSEGGWAQVSEMLVDEPRCFWQLIFSETEDNTKSFLCRGETLSLCVFLRHSWGSSDFRKTQCRWGILIHYFLSEDSRCDASSARLSRVWCSVGLLLQVLPVWRLAIPLPAVLIITVSLYMIVLGIGLWIRYCLKVGALGRVHASYRPEN